MQIIVVGAGKVGRALTAQLTEEGHDIVVIDHKPELVETIVNIYDVRGVVGNGACYDVQKEAFEEGADLLIATTSSDEINMLACLMAKKIGTQHTIARIRNPEYERQLRFVREELGLSMVINPEKTTAREIARVLRFPSAIKREQFCRQRFELVEYRIGPGNPLAGMLLADLYRSIRVKVLVCAVARGQETIIPSGSFTLREGDKIYLTASPAELEAFFRNWAVIWRIKQTPEYEQLMLSVDVHAPNKLRANIQVQNFEEFFETFGVVEGDGMWRAPEDRVQIW